MLYVTEIGTLDRHQSNKLLATMKGNKEIKKVENYGTRRFLPHSLGLSHNPHPEPNQLSSSY
jgi:hypothetical protein